MRRFVTCNRRKTRRLVRPRLTPFGRPMLAPGERPCLQVIAMRPLVGFGLAVDRLVSNLSRIILDPTAARTAIRAASLTMSPCRGGPPAAPATRRPRKWRSLACGASQL